MLSIKQAAEIAGGDISGDPDLAISGINSLENAREGEISFLSNQKYLNQVRQTKASAIICSPQMRVEGKPLLLMKNPYLGFARLMQHFHPRRRPDVGIDPAAVIGHTAKVGIDVNISEGAYIGEHAVIGDRVDIYPGCYIGHNTVIGDDTVINANVSIYHDCQVGKRVIIHSGTVVGSDGFGFATDEEGKHHKIPQAGNVVIEDDVEIGANCSIDRAVLGSTVIGEGSKLDNLIQIAHNVQIGKRTFIVSQVGISGSSKVGDQSILAGQAGIVGHVEIGSHCIIAAQAGVSNNVPDNEVYLGAPARPMMEMKRIFAVQAKLPEMRTLVKQLEKRVEELESRKNNKS